MLKIKFLKNISNKLLDKKNIQIKEHLKILIIYIKIKAKKKLKIVG